MHGSVKRERIRELEAALAARLETLEFTERALAQSRAALAKADRRMDATQETLQRTMQTLHRVMAERDEAVGLVRRYRAAVACDLEADEFLARIDGAKP